MPYRRRPMTDLGLAFNTLYFVFHTKIIIFLFDMESLHLLGNTHKSRKEDAYFNEDKVKNNLFSLRSCHINLLIIDLVFKRVKTPVCSAVHL